MVKLSRKEDIMNKLEEGRTIINKVDSQLVELFEERMHAVEKILEYKKENNMQIFDSSREKENIERTSAKLNDKELTKYFVDFYQHMMDVSKNYQKDLLKETSYENVK